MDMQEKQWNKVEKLFELISEEYVKPEELAAVFAALHEAINKFRADLEQNMAQNKGEMTEEMERMHSEMMQANTHLEALMTKMEGKMSKECERMGEQCMQKIKEVEEMIPAPADFSAIEARVSEVEGKIPKIPEIPNIQPLQEDIENIHEDIKEIRKDIEELKRRPVGTGGGTSAMGVARAFKYIFHTEQPTGLINGANTTYTVKNNIWAIVGFTLNGESIAELPNYTFINHTITFSSALPADYSGKDFEVKYIGT